MSSNKAIVPEAKQGLNRFKTEIANSLGVTLKDYNGDLTSKQAGSIGGEMVKRMISDYESRNLRK
jgi:small acid-soluble spore protein D (minor alpha/beta-type SASP)